MVATAVNQAASEPIPITSPISRPESLHVPLFDAVPLDRLRGQRGEGRGGAAVQGEGLQVAHRSP